MDLRRNEKKHNLNLRITRCTSIRKNIAANLPKHYDRVKLYMSTTVMKCCNAMLTQQ